ncbi:MAG: hypothetical protein EOO81_03665 [Oxalobacteraceae bacterium]|nr:MAG: hypothetical protein EOO81_03665 [Oxalobacteraceae bacterium]
MSIRITLSEHEMPTEVSSAVELESILAAAAVEAAKVEKLNVVFLEASNGNTLNLAVGGQDTSLGFVHGHGDPPYFISKGDSDFDEPVLTCYIPSDHHTEYPRSSVVPSALGLAAALEFLITCELPLVIEWQTV